MNSSIAPSKNLDIIIVQRLKIVFFFYEGTRPKSIIYRSGRSHIAFRMFKHLMVIFAPFSLTLMFSLLHLSRIPINVFLVSKHDTRVLKWATIQAHNVLNLSINPMMSCLYL